MRAEWFDYLVKFENSFNHLHESGLVKNGDRGKFRTKLNFSAAKYEAIKKGGSLEDALEKTLVWLLQEEELKRQEVTEGQTPETQWFNQFNLANGAGGQARESVDFGRQKTCDESSTIYLDLFELKQWNETDSLSHMLEELLRYSCQLSVLNKNNAAPYSSWPRRIVANLWCIGPTDFYTKLGKLRLVNKDLSKIATRFSSGKLGTLLSDFSIMPEVIPFKKALTKQSFLDCFNLELRGPIHPSDAIHTEAKKFLVKNMVSPVLEALETTPRLES